MKNAIGSTEDSGRDVRINIRLVEESVLFRRRCLVKSSKKITETNNVLAELNEMFVRTPLNDSLN